jgi:hypothetical protein
MNSNFGEAGGPVWRGYNRLPASFAYGSGRSIRAEPAIARRDDFFGDRIVATPMLNPLERAGVEATLKLKPEIERDVRATI